MLDPRTVRDSVSAVHQLMLRLKTDRLKGTNKVRAFFLSKETFNGCKLCGHKEPKR